MASEASRRAWGRALCATALLVGCGGDDSVGGPQPSDGPHWPIALAGCPPGSLEQTDGSCRAAGIEPWGCAPGELPVAGGGCRAAGIPADGCGQGFAPDGQGGCEPLLPADPCPPGEMALPGETSCRPVAPCPAGRWGAIPTGPDTVYVDAAYGGGGNDGSSDRPWTSVQAGVDDAPAGAVVAIAAGSYAEAVTLGDHAVKLWGRCPALVSIVPSEIAAAVSVEAAASGSELHDLALTGPSWGLRATDAAFSAERVWIHDTGFIGVEVVGAPPDSSVSLSGTLVEHAYGNAVQINDAHLSLDGSVLRDTTATIDGGFGRALFVNGSDGGVAGLLMTHSVLVRQRQAALIVVGSQAQVVDSLLSQTEPMESDDTTGYGVIVGGGAAPADFVMSGSVVEHSHECGVCVGDSTARLARTVIRDTAPSAADGQLGQGALVLRISGAAPTARLELVQSLVEHNRLFGVGREDGALLLESTIVRGILPQTSDGVGGWGLRGLAPQLEPAEAPELRLDGCLIEGNVDAGVISIGGRIEVDHTWVRDTAPAVSPYPSGYGILVATEPNSTQRSSLGLWRSQFDSNGGAAVALSATDGQMDAVRIDDTAGDAHGSFGYGVALEGNLEGAEGTSLVLNGSEISRSGAAGIIVSGSTLDMQTTIVRDTRVQARDGYAAGGVLVQTPAGVKRAGQATLRGVVLADNAGAGLVGIAATATIEHTLVSGGAARSADGHGGVGVVTQADLASGAPGELTLSTSLLDRNLEMGVLVQGAEATVTDVWIRNPQARSGTAAYGDGVTVNVPNVPGGVLYPTHATLLGLRIEGAVRAGVSDFGGSVEIGDTWLDCNLIALDGEQQELPTYSFVDLGGNDCGCGQARSRCKVLSSNLAPPDNY